MVEKYGKCISVNLDVTKLNLLMNNDTITKKKTRYRVRIHF